MVSIKEEEDEDQETPPQQLQENTDHHTPQMESESSPLRSPIPTNPVQLHSKSKPPPQREPPIPHENLSQIIAKDRRINGFSPLRSPEPQSTQEQTIQSRPLSPVIVVNRSIRDELNVAAAATTVDPAANRNSFPRVSTAPAPPPPGGRRSRAVSSHRKDGVMKKSALGFRVCAAVFCLISFSVMAADKTQGWAGDSFDRYQEYRYCLSMTVIGFVYAGFQAVDLACHSTAGRHVIQNDIRYYFDFFMDQILTYLLISASSAGASRVDDWQSNWGKDEFTVMASASIGMSFLAFVAFAFSSLISGYNLCMHFQT